MRGTGLLDAYEAVIEKLVTTGWPSEKTIFDHAAYELLKWNSINGENYAHNISVNPGAAGLQSVGRRRETDTSPQRQQNSTSKKDINFLVEDDDEWNIDRQSLRNASPSKRGADFLKQTSQRYPEMDQAAQIENYKRQVQEIEIGDSIKPIELKSKKTNNSGS